MGKLSTIFCVYITLFSITNGVPWIPEPRNDPNWMNAHNSFVNTTLSSNGRINAIFLGASIVDWFPDDLFNENYARYGAVNYGISGDGVEHALWRLQNGEIQGLENSLSVIVFADCGSNSAGQYNAEEIARGYEAVIETIQERLPRTRVLMMGLMPRDNGFQDRWIRLVDVNIRNAKFDDGNPGSRIRYLDLWTQFSRNWGTVEPDLFLEDQLHLTRAGYEKWVQIINPLFRSMIQI